MKYDRFFEDADGKWRYRVVARNGKILTTSEAYEGGRSAAERGFADLLDTLADEITSDDGDEL